MNRTAAFIFGLLCLGVGLLLRSEPAATQNTGTDLGSLTTQNALQRLTVPQNSDIMILYRGNTGAAVYTTSSSFTFAMSAQTAQTSFGGL